MLSKPLADVEDAGLCQSNLRCNGTIGQPRLTQSDNLPPTLFLRRRRQLAHIDVFHPGKAGAEATIFKTTQAGSISRHLPDSRRVSATRVAQKTGMSNGKSPFAQGNRVNEYV